MAPPPLYKVVEFKEGGGGSRNMAIRTWQSWLPGERRDLCIPSNIPRATKVLRLAIDSRGLFQLATNQ